MIGIEPDLQALGMRAVRRRAQVILRGFFGDVGLHPAVLLPGLVQLVRRDGVGG